MRNVYKEHGRSAVFRDKSKGGLLSSFLKEYKVEFGVSVTPACGKCLSSYWNNYINLFQMNKPKIECAFRLKAKYNGIQIGANGDPIRNGEMTDEIAVKLLEWHPLHEGLFDEIPSKDNLRALGSDESLSLADLRLRHSGIKSNSKDGFLKKLAESKDLNSQDES